MGSIGNCCCAPCVPCEEQIGLTNWEIVGTVLGFDFAGEFGELDERLCRKLGSDCERATVMAGDTQAIGDWSSWTDLWKCDGPCIDCDTGTIDDSRCSINIGGGIVCPPDMTQYPGEQAQSRGGIRVRFWYVIRVYTEVLVFYTNNKVKFLIAIWWDAVATTTTTSRSQQRKREVTYQCVTDLLMTVGPTTDLGDLTIPAPSEPCVDLLNTAVNTDVCVAPDLPQPNNPCETVVTTSKTYDCVVVENFQCVTKTFTNTIPTDISRECCERGEFCAATPSSSGVAFYDSIEYPCNEVPETIPLTLAAGGANILLRWTLCSVDAPADVNLSLPSTLELQVS